MKELTEDLINLLRDLGNYMDNRSDILEVGDHEGRQVPNEEMQFSAEIQIVIERLKELQ